MTAAALALALAALQGPPARSAARVLVVGAGGYPTLAAAVAAAAPGDTVRVRAGRHTGTTVVDRALVIVGEPGAVLDGEGRGTVVTLAADSIVLAGLAVEGSGRSLDDDEAAVKVDHCTGCTVERLAIAHALHGIYLLEARAALVRGNTILGDTTLREGARGNGIHLFNTKGSRLAGNRIHGTRDGIYFSFADHDTVTDNAVTGVRYGLHYMYSNDNRFERNVFRRNAAGAAIMFSNRILFRDNVFAEHVGYRAYGILMQTDAEITAEGNRIEGNLTGIFMDLTTRSRFVGNTISGNGIGVDLLSSAEDNVFTGNVLTGNRTAVRRLPGGGLNHWAERGRGNYWGDARIFDLDGDGIGDRPYRAGTTFDGLAAGRPALAIFSGTLAARALDWAEEAFPVFEVSRAVDSAPLVRRPDAPRDDARAVGSRPPARIPGRGPMLSAAVVVACTAAWRRRRRSA